MPNPLPRWWAPWALPAACLLTAASTFGPWARSGARVRTSYELLDVADRAGVLPSSIAGAAAVWLLVPALAGGVVLAAALARARVVAALAVTLGALVGTGAVLVVRSPLPAAGAVGPALVLATGTVVGGLVRLTVRQERRR